MEDLEVCYDNGSPRTSIITTRRPERSAATGRCAGMRPCLPWAAAAACGGFAVLGVVREYNMRDEESRMEANFKLSYRKDSAFRMGSRVTDLLIGSYVTQQVIASQDHRSSWKERRRQEPFLRRPQHHPPVLQRKKPWRREQKILKAGKRGTGI